MALRTGRVLRVSTLLTLLTAALMLLMLIWSKSLNTLPKRSTQEALVSGGVRWSVHAPDTRRAATSARPSLSTNGSVPTEYRRRQLAVAVQQLQRQVGQLRREGRSAAFTGRPVAAADARQLLLLSSWRSGSSFVGKLLASQPLAFYLFEPLKWLASGGSQVPPERRAQALRDALRCNFSALSQPGALVFTVRSPVADAVCARLPDGCRSRELLEQICALHPVRVLKTVRARVHYLEELVRSSPRLTLVLLVRDPRAVVHSRRHSAWCRRKCGSVPLLCQWMSESLRGAAQLERQLPGRVVTTRYEDLTLDVSGGARRLFNSLQIPLTTRTVQFLMEHTGQPQQVAAELLGTQPRHLPLQAISQSRLQKERRNQYSTFRNSSAAAQDWRRTMAYQRVTAVQTECTEALRLIGYRVFSSQSELRNLSVTLETAA
ncbi:carbohydrate sulfotransferase 3-like [Amphibalanus amphitrite]|uniref:carbohydrate sulfotransferase 3-like n=1 Tax=Amphibalanus amphitrite TaxID=1232801 RepID=UPI001C9078C6|nr:carbohydrate sulfotransferase 3-like [Amphibalanus amphitrite]